MDGGRSNPNEVHEKTKPIKPQKAFSAIAIEIATPLVMDLATKAISKVTYFQIGQILVTLGRINSIRMPLASKVHVLGWWAFRLRIPLAQTTFLGIQIMLELINPNLIKIVCSNPSKLHAYDLEIDRIFPRLLRSPRSSEVLNSSSHKSSIFVFDFVVLKYDNADFNFDLAANYNYDLGVCISKFSLDNMTDNNMTLKELTTPDIMCQP
ncbi:hypothetical protein CR513_50379, partial [Mucuna pruriens]